MAKKPRKYYRDRARAANSASYQRELATARAWKQRVRGICERCGGETRYEGHGATAARWCAACSRIVSTERNKALAGTGPTQARIIELIDSGVTRFTALSDAAGLTRGHTAKQLNRLVGLGIIVRVRRGEYARG